MFKSELALILSVALLATSTVEAAPVTWSNAYVPFNSASQVFNEGETYVAVNFSGPTVTVNGVTFENVGLGGNVDGNAVSITRPKWTMTGGSFRGANVDAPNIYTASTDTTLNQLLDSFYTGQTLTLTGLEVGKTYSIQVWAADNRNAAQLNSQFTDGTNLSAQWSNFGTNGQGSALGTFTADATTQSISALSDANHLPHWNAFSVLVVPEPGAMSLALVGASAICFRRRN